MALLRRAREVTGTCHRYDVSQLVHLHRQFLWLSKETSISTIMPGAANLQKCARETHTESSSTDARRNIPCKPRNQNAPSITPPTAGTRTASGGLTN